MLSVSLLFGVTCQLPSQPLHPLALFCWCWCDHNYTYMYVACGSVSLTFLLSANFISFISSFFFCFLGNFSEISFLNFYKSFCIHIFTYMHTYKHVKNPQNKFKKNLHKNYEPLLCWSAHDLWFWCRLGRSPCVVAVCVVGCCKMICLSNKA